MIWIGGLVTSTGSGMAVPDWPDTYGYNLFLYPWQTWIYGPWKLFLEHGHRLFGTVVGMIAIAFLASTLLTKSRVVVRWLALAALVAVIAQGMLGGMRVRLDAITFAQIHGCVAPAFFAFTIVCAVVTSRRWREAEAPAGPGFAKLERLAAIITALAMLQIVLGSFLRHLPAGASPGHFRAILWFHLFIAAGLWAHIIMLAIRARRTCLQEGWIMRPVTGLSIAIVAQIVLGLATWVTKYGFPAWLSDYEFAAAFRPTADAPWQISIATAHVAIGSMILGTSVLLAMRAHRLAAPREKAWDSATQPAPLRRDNGSKLLMEVAR
jgi:cytochrome c oxidase assembly protein subunit 15